MKGHRRFALQKPNSSAVLLVIVVSATSLVGRTCRIIFVRSTSELKSERQLQVSIAALGNDDSETAWLCDRGSGRVPNGVVEGVEHLDAEFRLHAFTDTEDLEEGGVERASAGSAKIRRGARRVAESEVAGLGEDRLIEIGVDPFGNRSRLPG